MRVLDPRERQLTGSIIGAFFEVYNELRFGYFEHLYSEAVARELVSRGHQVAREVCVRVFYRGEELGTQKLDMVVDGAVIVEIKSTERLHPASRRQLYSYLRSTNLEIGLLLHIGPDPAVYRQVFRHASRP